MGVETGGALGNDAGAGEERDAATESALEPIVFAGIEEDAEEYKNGRGGKKMQEGHNPEDSAAKGEQSALHI